MATSLGKYSVAIDVDEDEDEEAIAEEMLTLLNTKFSVVAVEFVDFI